jgi:UDP-N-acetylmuramoyl-L-alanyl-D-glutamate--2,6-diaminopimelate ligase
LIGVTGTNGKTTTTFLIEHILRSQGFRTGLMGTIQMKIGDEIVEAKNTTPDALELQRNFRRMADAGTDYCVMEVSSHALEQGRVKGCDFRTALFTNLTQDHLDYHRTMDKYREAKGLLFARLGNTFSRQASSRKFAVLNADDPASSYFQKLTSAEVITYGIEQEADIRAENIRLTEQGTEFTVRTFAGEARVALQLFGRFNVYNALGAIAATLAEGVPLSAVAASLEQVTGVPGRFENVREGQDFLVVVDYAHTPDSLENVLKTIADFAAARIICVVGCGGDRDRGKRPIMAGIAARYSDYTIITSDNPRSEDPEQIMLEMEKGLIDQGVPRKRYELIADRKKAIEKAVEMASPKDVVLIAGKGHETYQEIQGVRYEFDDRLVAKNAIRRIRLDQTNTAPPARHD